MLNYLILDCLLFALGIFGIVFNRQNLIIIFMSIELMLLSVTLNFLFFSLTMDDLLGEIFALIILTVAAAESAIGLALMIVFFRIRGTISVLEINKLSL